MSEHLLVGMKIVILVLPSIGSYISDDARSCVSDDWFAGLYKSQISVRKSPILEISHLPVLKQLHFIKQNGSWTKPLTS